MLMLLQIVAAQMLGDMSKFGVIVEMERYVNTEE
jgi:hypothetical protein